LSIETALRLAQNVQDLLLRQKKQTQDTEEMIECMDSLFNILHGIREDQREDARFESGFREGGLESIDELDAEEEAEQVRAFEERRSEALADIDRLYRLHNRP
jgi:hypothetical protein